MPNINDIVEAVVNGVGKVREATPAFSKAKTDSEEEVGGVVPQHATMRWVGPTQSSTVS